MAATGPNQIWCWDITWLRSTVRGRFFFAYVIIDIFSRKIVGWTIHEYESPELARDLFNQPFSALNRNHILSTLIMADL